MSTCAVPSCQQPKAPGRIWCEKHGTKNVMKAAPAVTKFYCRKIRQGDEFYCGYCHQIWAVDDADPPPCEANTGDAQ